MTYTEITYRYNDCTVRVRKPNLMDNEKIKKATEKFLKNVIKEREVCNER